MISKPASHYGNVSIETTMDTVSRTYIGFSIMGAMYTLTIDLFNYIIGTYSPFYESNGILDTKVDTILGIMDTDNPIYKI